MLDWTARLLTDGMGTMTGIVSLQDVAGSGLGFNRLAERSQWAALLRCWEPALHHQECDPGVKLRLHQWRGLGAGSRRLPPRTSRHLFHLPAIMKFAVKGSLSC